MLESLMFWYLGQIVAIAVTDNPQTVRSMLSALDFEQELGATPMTDFYLP